MKTQHATDQGTAKQSGDARPCLACGKPTWSAEQHCSKCRHSADGPMITVKRRDPRAVLRHRLELAEQLPHSTYRRFGRRLFRKRLRMPPTVFTVILAVGLTIPCVIITAIITAFIDDIVFNSFDGLQFGPEYMFVMLAINLTSLSVIIFGPVPLAMLMTRRIARRMIARRVGEHGGWVIMRECPSCGQSQRGTPGMNCPECATQIRFVACSKDAARIEKVAGESTALS